MKSPLLTKRILLISSIAIVLLLAIFHASTSINASRLAGDFTPSAYTFMSLILKAAETTQTPTLTPTTMPSPSPTPTNPSSSAPVEYVNMYRVIGGLPPVTENLSWSDGDWLHSRYMVKNDVIEHDEDVGNPWYSPEGQAAAQNSNLAVSSSATYSDESVIDGWMVAPFHGIGILDPALSMVGFGSYREADGGWQTGAGLDIIRGLGIIPPEVTFPIMWPGDDQTVGLTTLPGYESPNPLTSCPAEYMAPAGLPVYLQIGSGGEIPNVTASTFSQGGSPLEHCIFDETNYTNPDSGLQSLGRAILNSRDAMILIPRYPLSAGLTYAVSITVNSDTHTWTFTVAPLVKPMTEAHLIIK